ncbi:MAG: hypothetical protein ABJB22_03630 [Verrucomicrobiota bacterium]
MSHFEKSAGRKVALHWLLGTTALLYVLSRFLPSALQKHYGIDDSYVEVLHEAFRQHWQFGRDIVFTFGPLGFLYGGFHPATHFISIIVWAALALVFWWAGWRIARHFFGNEMIAWLWLMFFVGASSVTIFLNMDVRLTAFAVFLLLLHFFVEDKSWTVMQAALTISLGLLSLVKFSEFVLAVVIVIAIAANSILRYRRFPWVLLVFGASVLLFWILARQHLSSLAPFLASSWRITSGYTEAMMLTSANEMWDVGCFIAATTLLCALVGHAAWVRHRFIGIIPVVGFGFILFAAFKYGYVRHDGHEVTAVLQLLLMSLVCFALLWPMARVKGYWAVIANFLPVVGICFFAAITFSRHSETGLPATFARTLGSREIFAPLELFRGKRHLVEAHEKFLGDFRNEFPLPPIKGSVDVYPWNQAAVLAQGLDYRPRPVLQSYIAYTRELAELNAGFLRSDRAPENILFELWTIDDRFPSLDDGPSWPELLTRYEVVGRSGNFVRLQRRAKPRRYEMIPLGESSFELGTKQSLPSTDAGPIWAEIEITQSLRGKIASFFYKPPVLLMTTTLKDGRSRPFRIVPAMARGGFLISPVAEGTKSFALLSLTNSMTALADFEVASISLFADTKSGTTGCYRSPMRLRFYRLSISD